MTTLVFGYHVDEESEILIDKYISQYSSCRHVLYNFIKDNSLSTNYQDHIISGSLVLEKLHSLNNVELISGHYYLTACVIADVCGMIKSEEEVKELDRKKLERYKKDFNEYIEKTNKPDCKKKKYYRRKIKKLDRKIRNIEHKKYVAIFGGRKNFMDRCKGSITHDEYVSHKQSMLYSKGSKEHFNRLFEIVDEETILFKPTKDIHITIKIPKNKYPDQIHSLLIAQANRELPCTFKLSKDKIYLSYDPSKLNEKKYSSREYVKNRVMSIDMNPDYIGWCITDWRSEGEFSIIKSGVVSIKEINDIHFSYKDKGIPSDDKRRIHLNNKREHEIFEISKKIINTARYYKCETFSIEKITMESDDKNKGAKYNALCNNLWSRNKLVNNLKKRCATFHIEFIEIMPNYSSFVGNFLFRSLNLPDMVLAAFELTRRTYQYKYNYTLPKEERKQNILLPDTDVFKSFMSKSLEEFDIEDVHLGLRQIYDSFKKAKTMYRLPLDKFNLKFSRFCTVKSKIECYQFNTPITYYN